jgi:hypothetical protein
VSTVQVLSGIITATYNIEIFIGRHQNWLFAFRAYLYVAVTKSFPSMVNSVVGASGAYW